jgi:hypothetical protein
VHPLEVWVAVIENDNITTQIWPIWNIFTVRGAFRIFPSRWSEATEDIPVRAQKHNHSVYMARLVRSEISNTHRSENNFSRNFASQAMRRMASTEVVRVPLEEMHDSEGINGQLPG